MSAVRETLEALGHPAGAIPEPRLLADLFVRFQARVPMRPAAAGLPPEGHLAAWLEEGDGLCGGARVAAFEALAALAGFPLERVPARGPGGAARPLLLAAEGRLLLDPAFPLPAPLSLDPPAEAEPSGYGALSVRRAGDEPAVVLEARGEERVLYRVGRGAAPEALPAPGEDADRGAGERLFRLLDDRLLRWSDNVLEVSDAWSRLRIPFPAVDADGLESLFGPPVREPAAPDPDGVLPLEPSLAVYHASAARPQTLLRLLADPAVHAALLPEGWTARETSRRADGFERTLLDGDEVLRTERLALRPDGIAVEAEGPLALFRTRTWRLEPRAGGTRLRVLAVPRDPVPPRGLPEGTRRRLVFELASELLALDRLSAGR